MATIPKKTKYRSYHLVSHTKGIKIRSDDHVFYKLAKGNKEINWGKFGLRAGRGGEIDSRQIEAMRKVISRFTRKFTDSKHKPWKINIFPHFPKTKKPLEVRMGSGKGSIEKWISIVKEGTIIVELSERVPGDIAHQTFNQVGYKLPNLKCKVVEKN